MGVGPGWKHQIVKCSSGHLTGDEKARLVYRLQQAGERLRRQSKETEQGERARRESQPQAREAAPTVRSVPAGTAYNAEGEAPVRGQCWAEDIDSIPALVVTSCRVDRWRGLLQEAPTIPVHLDL